MSFDSFACSDHCIAKSDVSLPGKDARILSHSWTTKAGEVVELKTRSPMVQRSRWGGITVQLDLSRLCRDV